MPLAKILDPGRISPADRQHIMARVFTNCEERGDCLMWSQSVNSSGYPQMRIKLANGAGAYALVHRLVYAIKSGRVLEPPHPGEMQYEVSHLCHNKTCMRFDHLVYEPKAINSDRRSCKSNGICHREHHFYRASYPNCIIHCKYDHRYYAHMHALSPMHAHIHSLSHSHSHTYVFTHSCTHTPINP
jgi:hypothetical protein